MVPRPLVSPDNLRPGPHLSGVKVLTRDGARRITAERGEAP